MTELMSEEQLRGVLLPYSQFRTTWDLITMFFVIYTAINLPIQVPPRTHHTTPITHHPPPHSSCRPCVSGQGVAQAPLDLPSLSARRPAPPHFDAAASHSVT